MSNSQYKHLGGVTHAPAYVCSLARHSSGGTHRVRISHRHTEFHETNTTTLSEKSKDFIVKCVKTTANFCIEIKPFSLFLIC